MKPILYLPVVISFTLLTSCSFTQKINDSQPTIENTKSSIEKMDSETTVIHQSGSKNEEILLQNPDLKDSTQAKLFVFPVSVFINGVALEYGGSGVLRNMEKWRYGSNLGSGVVSITQIKDGKFRSISAWKGGGEDTPLTSLDDFFIRDTSEILGMLDFLEQEGASDEKFMKYWGILKPTLGEVWTEAIDTTHKEFAYIYPQSMNVSCYFYDGAHYYRAEYQVNHDGVSLTEMSEYDIKEKLASMRKSLLNLKGTFCKSIRS